MKLKPKQELISPIDIMLGHFSRKILVGYLSVSGFTRISAIALMEKVKN
jgi:hypothetical protein